ncbi:MAG: hypothetical protein MK135_03915 [Polyangiaceae bacterium]|nr:hypothetical protein [Polyangiaceae bacterium]
MLAFTGSSAILPNMVCLRSVFAASLLLLSSSCASSGDGNGPGSEPPESMLQAPESPESSASTTEEVVESSDEPQLMDEPFSEAEPVVCDDGFFGAQCQACTSRCLYGTCDDGAEGSGGCRCFEGWAGDSCERLAAVLSFSHQEDESCVLELDGDVACWGPSNLEVVFLEDGGEERLSLPTQMLTATDYQVLRLGEDHGCAIDSAGALECWGRNASGELGIGTSGQATIVPTRVSAGPDAWLKVAPGGGHSCAIGVDRSLWCWGSNSYGQLGIGATDESSIATPQAVAVGEEWVDVATADDVSYGMKKDGTLWSWGSNSDGALGDPNNTEAQSEPMRFSSETDWLFLIATEEQEGACALKKDRSLWCWGRNDDGQLGTGDEEDLLAPTEILPGTQWMSFSVGEDTSCGVKMDGTLWCSGDNGDGELGQGTVGPDSLVFLQVGTDTDWIDAHSSNDHHYVIKSSGEIFALGEEAGGMGGVFSEQVDEVLLLEPQPVFNGADLTSVVLLPNDGWQETQFGCGLSSTGQTKCWGEFAEFAPEPDVEQSSQARVVDDAPVFTRLAGGSDTICGITEAGAIQCRGAFDGGLGDGTATESGSWITVTAPVDRGGAVELAVGDDHACAIFQKNAERTLWCWGSNGDGSLGDNSDVDRATVVQENSQATDWQEVFAFSSQTCALQESGAAFCWGGGELGRGVLSDDRDIPGELSSASTWISLSIGEYNTCGVKSDGTLWCWGIQNEILSVESDEPRRVHDSESSFQQVSVGENHACAVKTDDTLWCWGENDYGQLGSSDFSATALTQEASASSDWSEVTVGLTSTCAVKKDGAGAYCWGSSEVGQLGTNFHWIASPRQIYPSLN